MLAARAGAELGHQHAQPLGAGSVWLQARGSPTACRLPVSQPAKAMPGVPISSASISTGELPHLYKRICPEQQQSMQRAHIARPYPLPECQTSTVSLRPRIPGVRRKALGLRARRPPNPRGLCRGGARRFPIFLTSCHLLQGFTMLAPVMALPANARLHHATLATQGRGIAAVGVFKARPPGCRVPGTRAVARRARRRRAFARRQAPVAGPVAGGPCMPAPARKPDPPPLARSARRPRVPGCAAAWRLRFLTRHAFGTRSSNRRASLEAWVRGRAGRRWPTSR
jgi:hypothetical protein